MSCLSYLPRISHVVVHVPSPTMKCKFFLAQNATCLSWVLWWTVDTMIKRIIWQDVLFSEVSFCCTWLASWCQSMSVSNSAFVTETWVCCLWLFPSVYVFSVSYEMFQFCTKQCNAVCIVKSHSSDPFQTKTDNLFLVIFVNNLVPFSGPCNRTVWS